MLVCDSMSGSANRIVEMVVNIFQKGFDVHCLKIHQWDVSVSEISVEWLLSGEM